MSFRTWIKSQLTNARQNEIAWVDLAVAIVDTIEKHVESYITNLKARQSLYEMDRDYLYEDFKELRKIFPLGEVSDDDLPNVVMQRRDEIHFKKTLYPMLSTLLREFQGINVTWQPIYAPIDIDNYPYGTILIPESQIDSFAFTRDELFLTSRGVVQIPLTRVTEDELVQLENRIKSVIHPLIPLRIVFDGQMYIFHFTCTEFMEFVEYRDFTGEFVLTNDDGRQVCDLATEETTDTLETQEEMKVDPMFTSPRFDAIPMDAIAADRMYY